jgi:ribonuclease BN (tRNA processing enzyme)
MKKAAATFALAVLLALALAGCTSANPSTSLPPDSPSAGATPSTAASPTGLPAATSPLAYPVVDTGQVKCYDNAREIPAPQPGAAFYGQDAQHTGNAPAYRDNGDGTVSDLVTGLMWQKTPGAKVGYQEAVTGAKSLKLAGYADWRLPTIKELYSLILFSGLDVSPVMAGVSRTSQKVPFLHTRYFDFKYGDESAGSRIIDSQYWTSTEYVSTTMNGSATVFGVNFADGRIKGYPRQSPRGENLEFVRYVRGNPRYGVNDFTDNADGTITDRATGLMWARDDSGQGMNWQDALAWVQQLNARGYLGYRDWRLPNAKELQSIVDYARSPATTTSAAISPVFNTTRITNESGKPDYAFFWTGTTHADSNNQGTFGVYICFGEALGYMQTPQAGLQPPAGGQTSAGRLPPAGRLTPTTPGSTQLMDVHGAGAQRSDPKTGSAAAYPQGHGPQGDVVRILNYVRPVRDAATTRPQAIPAAPQGNAGASPGDNGTESAPASRFASDFSVTLTGTGGPNYDPKRAGPGTLIHYKDSFFLVDMGDGTADSLVQAGVQPGDIRTYMFTHHHWDHDVEFPELFIKAWVRSSDGFTILGPAGTSRLYDFVSDFYKEDIDYRATATGRTFDPSRAATARDLDGGARLELNGLTVRTAEVTHSIRTLAYRFDAGGKSIVISGDTAYSEALVELAQGADVLVMDSGAVIFKGGTPPGPVAGTRRRAAQTGPAPRPAMTRTHSTLAEVAQMAQAAGVKRLVLTHFSPGEVDEESTAKAIRAAYPGELIFGTDLMEVLCP